MKRHPGVGTVEQFEEFEPIEWGDDNQIMRDWNSPEFEVVHKAQESNPKTVWTVVDCDQHENDSGLIITAGFHWVNRVGYVLTKKPWTTGFEEYDY